LPFCFARFDGVLENALLSERMGEMVLLTGVARERERKDWRRGVRSRDVLVCETAILVGLVVKEFC
jgi:hypothetical protein